VHHRGDYIEIDVNVTTTFLRMTFLSANAIERKKAHLWKNNFSVECGDVCYKLRYRVASFLSDPYRKKTC